MDEMNYETNKSLEVVEGCVPTETLGNEKRGSGLAKVGIVAVCVAVGVAIARKLKGKSEQRMCKKLRKKGYTVIEPFEDTDFKGASDTVDELDEE